MNFLFLVLISASTARASLQAEARGRVIFCGTAADGYAFAFDPDAKTAGRRRSGQTRQERLDVEWTTPDHGLVTGPDGGSRGEFKLTDGKATYEGYPCQAY